MTTLAKTKEGGRCSVCFAAAEFRHPDVEEPTFFCGRHLPYRIERSAQGFARNILHGDKVVLHLQEGTTRNEEQVEALVNLLNDAVILNYDIEAGILS